MAVSYTVDPNDGGIAVGCVLRVGPRQQVNRDDIQVSRVEQLDSTLSLAVNEELVSNIINICIADSNVTRVNQRLLPATLTHTHLYSNGSRPPTANAVP